MRFEMPPRGPIDQQNGKILQPPGGGGSVCVSATPQGGISAQHVVHIYVGNRQTAKLGAEENQAIAKETLLQHADI